VLDYSATLCDPEGQIIAQAKTVALHLGAVPDAMAEVLARYRRDLAPGDVIVLNDPYAGGMHLPDVFMFKPIFADDALLGFAVVIAHQCDMGGRVPGSNASDSTEIYQEGLRIPPLKLYRRGVRDATLFAMIERNVRVPRLVLGDVEAQHAACRIGERELVKLVRRHGRATVAAYVRELIAYAERLTRSAIAAWPKGTFAFEDHIDGDGFDERPIPIRVAITVRDDHLVVDFAGTSGQVKGAINSTMSFTRSATYLSVRCALGREVPNNAGVFRCIEVRAPQGSILNPYPPAPVAARPGRAVGDVTPGRHPREQRVILEDEPDAAALDRERDPGRGVEPGLPADGHGPPLRPQQAGDRAQERALPGARRADEREALARSDLDPHVEAEITAGADDVSGEHRRPPAVRRRASRRGG